MRAAAAALVLSLASTAVGDPDPPPAFRELEQRFEAYDAMPTGREDTPVEQMLSRKLATARSLQGDFLAFARSASPEWEIAALYRSAFVMERFADGIDGLRREGDFPAEIQRQGEEETALYEKALEVRASAARAEAQSGYAMALNRAAATGVTNVWYWLAREASRRLDSPAGRACHSSGDCGSPKFLCVRGICREEASAILPPIPARPRNMSLPPSKPEGEGKPHSPDTTR